MATTGGSVTITGTAFGPVSLNLITNVGLSSNNGFQYPTDCLVTVEEPATQVGKIVCTVGRCRSTPVSPLVGSGFTALGFSV